MTHVINFALLLITLVLVFYWQALDARSMCATVIGILSVQFLAHYRHVVRRSECHPLLSLDFIFLLGLLAVNFIIPILTLFESSVFAANIFSITYSEYFIQAQPIAMLAVCGLCAGAAIGRALRRKVAYGVLRTTSRLAFDVLAIAFSVPGTLLLLYFLLTAGSQYLSGSYQYVYSIVERFETPFIVSQILLSLGAASAVCAAGGSVRRFRAVSIVVFIPYLVLLVVLAIHGDRGQLVLCSAPILYMVFSRESKLFGLPRNSRVLSVVLVVFIGLIVLSILREARNVDQRGISAIIASGGSFELREGLLGIVINLGSSGILLPTAVEYSEVHGHTLGRFAGMSTMGMVPYSRRMLQQAGLVSSDVESESAELLTNQVLGPGATSGVGTTSVADLYLDFGWIGVLIGHFLIGWLAVRLQRAGERSNADYRAKLLYVVSIGVFAIMARYSATSMLVRYVLYYGIAIFLASLLCSELLRTSSKLSAVPRGRHGFANGRESTSGD